MQVKEMRQRLLSKGEYLIPYQKQQRNIWYYTESAAKYLILCKNNSEV